MPPAPSLCDLRVPSVLQTALQALYEEHNPSKLSDISELAKKHARNPVRLAKLLEEKYPGVKLSSYCPTPIGLKSAWDEHPIPYTRAVIAVVAITSLFQIVGVPLRQQPKLAARIDIAVLVLLGLAAAAMKPAAHEFNALVLFVAGAELSWLFARNKRTKESDL